MRNIYSDLVSTYYEMKNEKIKICNDIVGLIAQREQLEHDIYRIESMLTAYGKHKSEVFVENKALEQEPILDKIRSEIESCREDEEPHLCDYRYNRNEGLDMALEIIDKYRVESEG